ncbi:MAG TPA: thermonuclease family protein [Candidatus Thioglobus sp.]|jgi:endonuclease YncB( thermonuclease family)|nr:thermonuclease family protein [Candidatus Thioglobus sp.]HIL20643.1 thermonuclease family protein [Candidatus Thioglobus sp.]
MKLFVLCLLFSFCSIAGSQSNAKHPLVIVDGDSVNINVLLFLDFAKIHQEPMDDRTFLKMRIAGIDTPEWNQTCEKNLGTVISCGELATKHLQHLLESLSGVLAFKPIGVDYYNRVLIRLFVGETNIGKQLVLDGMAYSYDETYLVEETLARKEKRGFWAFARPPISPKEWRKKK